MLYQQLHYPWIMIIIFLLSEAKTLQYCENFCWIIKHKHNTIAVSTLSIVNDIDNIIIHDIDNITK
ncbi:hypothetical protein O6H91_10G015500 [Diphasiastrum complanatum]|uniref:Uncharacterized protein n=1 Tax=Diphasiastrum complanatum TaxID=34168 RepID=A0ACC2CEL2_DIPCM|nr:hypothetical protein O6H91_10G015500 [Diphasiastrum complanatum]